MKTLANLVSVENPLHHHRLVYNTFDQRYKMVQTVKFLITYKKNVLIDYQYVFAFYKDLITIKFVNSFSK